MTFLDTVLDHATMLEQWAVCTVEDIDDAQFADQPAGLTNHPAWVLGHLTFAMDNLTRELGGNPQRDESWYAPFVGGSTPTSNRADYPGKDELITAFSDSCSSLREHVRNAGEAELAKEVANERIKAFFPTLGRWAAHVLLCEGAFHTGQLSAWRRAKNQPSVFENEANVHRILSA